MLANLIQEKKDLALLLLRLVLGLVFIVYGYRHVADISGYVETFTRIGIVMPGVMAPFVAWVEFLGGIAVLVGVLTRYAGLLLAITMAVSTLTAKLPAGLAQGRDPLGLSGFWDLDAALLVMGLALLLMGPGKFSLERGALGREL